MLQSVSFAIVDALAMRLSQSVIESAAWTVRWGIRENKRTAFLAVFRACKIVALVVAEGHARLVGHACAIGIGGSVESPRDDIVRVATRVGPIGCEASDGDVLRDNEGSGLDIGEKDR